jgi:hypothetical protein
VSDPTPEQVDAVAAIVLGYTSTARRILTTTRPHAQAALAANLPTGVMLAALVERGVLKEQAAPLMRDGDSWRVRWDGNHTHEGTRLVTPWTPDV